MHIIPQSLLIGDIQCVGDSMVSIGSEDAPVNEIHCRNLIGSVSDSSIQTDSIVFPFTGVPDARLRRTAPSVLALDNNSAGAVTINHTGTLNTTTVSATNVSASSAVTTPSVVSGSSITLTPAVNQNVVLSPSGTGSVSVAAPVRLANGGSIYFGTQGRIFNNNNNSWQLLTNGGSQTGTFFGVDSLYTNGIFASTSGQGIIALNSTGMTLGAGKNVLFSGSTSGQLTLNPPSTITSHSYTLPSAQGAAGSVLTNNGSGALSWTGLVDDTITSGTVSDSNGVAGQLSFRWQKLSPKVRILSWDAVDFAAGANNNPSYPIATVAAFGDPRQPPNDNILTFNHPVYHQDAMYAGYVRISTFTGNVMFSFQWSWSQTFTTTESPNTNTLMAGSVMVMVE